MAEDDHTKYRPGDGDDDGETDGMGSSRSERENGEYLHRPAVEVGALDGEEPEEADLEGTRPDASTVEESSTAEHDESPDNELEDVEWTGSVGHAAGVETPIPRNLMASIVAVFTILGGAMALLGLLFSGIDLVILDSPQVRFQVSLFSPTALLTAIPAQAGIVAVIAGFYAGTREEGTEAVVAAAVGTFLGVVIETVLVAAFVSSSANLPLRFENLGLSAVFLGTIMAVVAALCAILYGQYITHPDGLLGRLSDRLAADERGDAP
ncbi:MAG: hypothetical protein ACI9PP_000379 [Halobacteriales archaeon]|jgi:hypothetical protein